MALSSHQLVVAIALAKPNKAFLLCAEGLNTRVRITFSSQFCDLNHATWLALSWGKATLESRSDGRRSRLPRASHPVSLASEAEAGEKDINVALQRFPFAGRLGARSHELCPINSWYQFCLGQHGTSTRPLKQSWWALRGTNGSISNGGRKGSTLLQSNLRSCSESPTHQCSGTPSRDAR
jgi:hypothetical protein